MSRAIAPAVGVVCLLAVTVGFAGAVGAVVLDQAPLEPPPKAALSASADAETGRLTFVHRGGDALDATALSVRVRVDGTPLDAQPSVPFFSATGFRPGPTGPFNSAADGRWEAGETASFELARTNGPLISEGSVVSATLTANGSVVAELERTA